MNKLSRIIILLASVILLIMFICPIWSISLEAPQYPEGLGLNIHINTITGHKPNDLQSINGLNHYIGMKTIEPSSITELKIMPYVIGFMMLFGLIILLLNKKYLIWIWIAVFIIIAIVGLYDFYLWGFDYGHNLSPHAIIKIPGMYYQPPVFGSKQLLNFTAHSYPYIGGIAAFLSIVLSLVGLIFEGKKK